MDTMENSIHSSGLELDQHWLNYVHSVEVTGPVGLIYSLQKTGSNPEIIKVAIEPIYSEDEIEQQVYQALASLPRYEGDVGSNSCKQDARQQFEVNASMNILANCSDNFHVSHWADFDNGMLAIPTVKIAHPIIVAHYALRNKYGIYISPMLSQYGFTWKDSADVA